MAISTALDRPRVRVLSLDQAVDDRIDGLTEWLTQNASQCRDQAHLNEGSPERAYWHAGYLAALRDLRDVLRGRNDSLN
jgi:hypothetical protein